MLVWRRIFTTKMIYAVKFHITKKYWMWMWEIIKAFNRWNQNFWLKISLKQSFPALISTPLFIEKTWSYCVVFITSTIPLFPRPDAIPIYPVMSRFPNVFTEILRYICRNLGFKIILSTCKSLRSWNFTYFKL